MILTSKESEMYNYGKINKTLFKKLMFTVGFENYLYRYCVIVNDYRNENFNTRETEFNLFGYSINVFMINGICDEIKYREL
jgi:hypothetical protein